MNICQFGHIPERIFQKFGVEYELQRRINARLLEEFGPDSDSDDDEEQKATLIGNN